MLLPIPKRSALGENLKWEQVVDSKQIRFISLINNDTKAWARLLNRKLNKIIVNLVHNFCFSIPKRNLQQAVLLVKYISEPKNIKRNTKPVILKLDYSNAFDLTSQLHLLNYMENLIGEGWFMDNLYNLIQHRMVVIKFDQVTSKPINMSVGLLQGCPLSAALYTVYMNILAKKINRLLSGITTKNTDLKVKVIHYIDDMLILCKDEGDLKIAWKVLNLFSSATGAKLNLTKTESLNIYEQLCFNDVNKKKLIKIKLLKSKLYGLYPFGNVKKASYKSFKAILLAIDEQMNRRKFHNSSLTVKVKILNAVFTSKFVYSLPLLKINKTMMAEYNRKCNKFLWNKMIHVPFNIVSLPQEFGGLGLISIENLDKSLKYNFYLKMINNDDLPTKCKETLTNYYLKEYIKSKDDFHKTIETLKKENQLISKISHGMYSKIKAKTTGKVELPKIYKSKIKKLPINSSLNSFLFKILWNRLPTSSHLKKKRHMINIEDKCVMCEGDYEENITHLMYDCDFAKNCKREVAKITGIKIDLFPNAFDVTSWNKKSSKIEMLYLFMMELIWKKRNQKIFGGTKAESTFINDLKDSLNKVKKLKVSDFPKGTENLKSIK